MAFTIPYFDYTPSFFDVSMVALIIYELVTLPPLLRKIWQERAAARNATARTDE